MPVTINGTTGFAGPLTGAVTGDVTGNASTATRFQSAPAFAAYQSSAQALAATTYTKIQLQTEEYDTNNCFDNATNYRFTPTVAGYYQINGAVTLTTSGQVIALLYKNGTVYKSGTNTLSAGTAVVSSLVYFNGTTDYVELYGYFATAQNTNASISTTYMNGVLVKPA